MIEMTITQEQAMQYARDNEQAAAQAKADGQARTARILKKTAAEWRSIAVRLSIQERKGH